MTSPSGIARNVLVTAGRVGGLATADASLIREGSNVLFRLPGDVVARIGRAGTGQDAVREVNVSRWLTAKGIRVVQALPDVPQPTMVDDRPVTWWRLIPDHRPATTGELGSVLRALHALSPPVGLTLPAANPIPRLAGAAENLCCDDGQWLIDRLSQLSDEYERLDRQRAARVIHGDAWQGNIAVPDDGAPILLDLEHVCLGDPDLDLVPLAVDYVDFARLGPADYRDFVDAYGGRDVTTMPGFRTLADLEELRWTCFVLAKAGTDARVVREARHRIACLRGKLSRPWTWTAY